MNSFLAINGARLLQAIDQLAQIGATETGGCSRLALSDADKEARDWVVLRMKEAGLEMHIDCIGNIFGIRRGENPDLGLVMSGSHIDTVRNGGKLDGNYGVLAALEVVRSLDERRQIFNRGYCVAVFTNEEGVRYQPDMLGSLVHAGGYALADALKTKGIDQTVLGDELKRIGYAGTMPCGLLKPSAFIELHIEQGPVLEAKGIQIGVVENLQGISWTDIAIQGQSNHAGTTPMSMRHDAAFVAASIAVRARTIAQEMGPLQHATVGMINVHPNLINVIASKATLSVDLRNIDEAALRVAESRLMTYLDEIAASEGVSIRSRSLARFEPVEFDRALVECIEQLARGRSLTNIRMSSGAGHDAQMMARIAPSAMIFVPSTSGVSHNPAEHTDAADLINGANVLLDAVATLVAS